MKTKAMKPLIFIFCLCLSPILTAQNTNQNKIQEAMANYDYETAIELINKEKPTIPLLMQQAKALKGIGNNAEALRVIRQVITADSTNQQAHIEAAECCKAMAKYNDALDYYRKTITLNPKNKYARLQFINLLCNTKNYAEAFGESSMMSETDSSAVVLHLQAQSLEGMQQILPAIGCYEIIQDKYPDDYLAAAKLGNLNIAAGYPEYAIKATERYRERDSTNLIVNQQNALAYCRAQQYPMAIKRYENLCQQGDSSTQTLYYLGISYYADEYYYEAHACFSKLYKDMEEDPYLLYYLGRCCAKTSWKKEGIEHLEKAIELTIPKDSAMIRLYKGLVDCCKLARDTPKQIQALKELYKYDKTNHKLLYDIAWNYSYQLKDHKSTERYLQAFLKTRNKDAKKEEATAETGELVLGLENYYNAADKWLKDLQKEKFFNEGIPEQSPK